MTTTVNRRDILLEEDSFPTAYGFGVKSVWRAMLDGRLSTGEEVRVGRNGDTSAEALANLEKAIAENGWVVA